MPALLNRIRLLTGVIIWIAILALLWHYGRIYLAASSQAIDPLTTFLATARQQIEIEFEDISFVQIGDPIVVFEGETAEIVGSVVQISREISVTTTANWTTWARIELFAAMPPIRDGDYLSYHCTPDSMDWVVQMMLPPTTRSEIGGLILQAYREHHAKIAEMLQPIIVKSIREAADVVREEFNNSISRRDIQIQKLADRYQIELVEQELIPLIQDEIWPIIQEEITPLAMEIGEDIWQHASIWRFGWRAVYDSLPLTDQKLVQREFQRFLETHAVPVIESRLPDILALQTDILQNVSANAKVREVVSNVSRKVLRDPEFQQLTADMLRDVFIGNERLTEVFERNWNSEQARDALKLTNDRLDPTITDIGIALFGSPETRITPEFSRVLRYKILNKDDRWLVLHLQQPRSPAGTNPDRIPVIQGSTGTENPFYVPRTEH